MTRKTKILTGAAVAVGAALLAKWQLQRLFTEEPDYLLERRIGPIEIRRYAPVVQATTTVSAPDWDAALESGFERLAGYIFGGNHPRGRVPMTGPVTHRTERLPMTSPVTQSGSPERGFTMTFTMPRGRSLDSLPHPDDSRVVLSRVPSRRVAVLKFSGRYTGDRVAEKMDDLQRELSLAGLEGRGEPEFAGYDSPSTAPFLRRNEIWLDLAPSRS